MDITLAPERFTDQSALAEGVTLRVRDKLGASSLTLASRYLPGCLLVDYYSLRGKLCTVRFFFSPAVPERDIFGLLNALIQLAEGEPGSTVRRGRKT